VFEGYVARVKLDGGFGFIAALDMPDIYFHREYMNDSLEFNEQLQGRRVLFETEPGRRGLRAINVRAAV
jgi:cold shock CspA family protein